jgi:hypothetical protein
MQMRGKSEVQPAYQGELDSINKAEVSEKRRAEGGLEVLAAEDHESVMEALDKMDEETKERFITDEHKKLFASREEVVGLINDLKGKLDALDERWSDRDDQSKAYDPSDEVVALRGRYDDASAQFDAVSEQLDQAEDEYEADPEVKKIRQHKDVLEKTGVDLRERSVTLEGEISDLQEQMVALDAQGNRGHDIDQNLSIFMGLQAELDALNSGEWQKKGELGWIPTKKEGGYFGVKVDVPDWLPNYGAEVKGKQVLSREAVQNRADVTKGSRKVRKGAIERGEDPNEY